MARLNDPECTVRLRLRRRVIAAATEVHSAETTVHCPLTARAKPLAHCERCQRFDRVIHGEKGGFIECRVPVESADARDLCGELLSPELTCLDTELEAARAAQLLEIAGVTSAPVLDDNQVLIGMVSTTSLARIRLESAELHGFGGAVELEVEDAMSTEVVTLSQQATLGEAARLMAARDLDRLPIVTDDGHLVGAISAMDLVRWLAPRLP